MATLLSLHFLEIDPLPDIKYVYKVPLQIISLFFSHYSTMREVLELFHYYHGRREVSMCHDCVCYGEHL